jgi:hypothetical protein
VTVGGGAGRRATHDRLTPGTDAGKMTMDRAAETPRFSRARATSTPVLRSMGHDDERDALRRGAATAAGERQPGLTVFRGGGRHVRVASVWRALPSAALGEDRLTGVPEWPGRSMPADGRCTPRGVVILQVTAAPSGPTAQGMDLRGRARVRRCRPNRAGAPTGSWRGARGSRLGAQLSVVVVVRDSHDRERARGASHGHGDARHIERNA